MYNLILLKVVNVSPIQIVHPDRTNILRTINNFNNLEKVENAADRCRPQIPNGRYYSQFLLPAAFNKVSEEISRRFVLPYSIIPNILRMLFHVFP